MKRVTAILTFALLTALALPLLASEEVVGQWKATVETRRGNNEITLEFTADDGGLQGTFTGRDGKEPLENVAYSEGTLTFQRFTEFQGQAASIDYTAEVQGDTMEVRLSTPRGERSFTAQRAPAER